MTRSLVLALVASCAAAAAARAGDNPARRAGKAPADAARLASGIAWKTIARGRGTAHPGPHDRVMVYGGSDGDSALVYYWGRPIAVDHAEPYVADALRHMVVGEKRRFWLPGGHVRDLELAAILSAGQHQNVFTFPPPSDALVGPTGLRSVVLEPAQPGGAPPAPADRVLLQVSALGADGKPVKLALAPGTITLADVPLAPLREALREMADGEQRFVWVPAARDHGTPLLLWITLVHVEHRPQLAAPADVAQAPAAARRLPSGASYVVLARGAGAPPVAQDEVVVDYTVWSDAGRTLEHVPQARWLVQEFDAPLAEQLATMRVGERRRVWIPAAHAGRFSEGGAGAVADLALLAIHRNVDLLPQGLKVELAGDELVVRQGGVRAPLGPGVHLDAARLSADHRAVTIETRDWCDRTLSRTVSIAALTARLENVRALALHRRKHYREAAAGFARAIALDPGLDVGYENLASALALGGDKAGAARALVPLARRNPVWVYARLLDDPELAGVAAEPALGWLRAAAPGHVDLATMPVMLDPHRDLVAAPVTEGSWGSGDSSTRIEIVDAHDGKAVATLPEVMWDLMSQPMTPAIRARVAKSKAHAERILDDLGFAAPAEVEAARVDDRDPSKARFVKARLGLVLSASAVRVVQRDAVLAEAAPVDGHIERAYWVPSVRLVVLYYGRAGHEGCEGTDPQGVAVIAVP